MLHVESYFNFYLIWPGVPLRLGVESAGYVRAVRKRTTKIVYCWVSLRQTPTVWVGEASRAQQNNDKVKGRGQSLCRYSQHHTFYWGLSDDWRCSYLYQPTLFFFLKKKCAILCLHEPYMKLGRGRQQQKHKDTDKIQHKRIIIIIKIQNTTDKYWNSH